MNMREEGSSVRVPAHQERDVRPAGLGGLVDAELVTTITKTLYSSGSVTRTISEGRSISLDTSISSYAAVASPSAITTNPLASGMSTTTISTTLTTTIYVFYAAPSSTTSNHASLAASDSSTTPAIPNTTNGSFSLNGSSVALTSARHAATITGATLGSVAAISLIGVLLWFCCYRNRSRLDKFKPRIKLQNFVPLSIWKRKPDTLSVPPFKNQKPEENEEQRLMEETRAIMLKRKSALKALERGNESQVDLIGMAAHPGMSSTHSIHGTTYQQISPPPLSRPTSTTLTQQSTHTSAIGLAVMNSPQLPLTPYSNLSQQQHWPQPVEMPAPLPYPAATARALTSSTTSVPTKTSVPRKQPQMKPAPIITSPRTGKPDRSSPLSPRAMFNKVSGAVKKLSPGGGRGADLTNDGRGGFEALLGEDSRLRNNDDNSFEGRAKVKAAKWI